MEKVVKKAVGVAKGDNRQPRAIPPWQSKSVLGVAAGMVGAGVTSATGDAATASGITALIQDNLPALMTAGASYIGGYTIGWGARIAMRTTALLSAGAAGLIGLGATLGFDGSAAQEWVNSAVAWAGNEVEGGQNYLLGLLPSATAAGAGGFVGFRKKRGGGDKARPTQPAQA